MLRSILFVSALLATFAALAAQGQSPLPAGYSVPADATMLSLSVQGEVRRVPDVASLGVGVVTEAQDGDAALRQNAQRMAGVIAAVRKAGIAEADLQTSSVHLSPQFRYREREAPRITSYQASNTITIKVREMARLGALMDVLAAEGANQIHGPSFELDDPEPARDEARRAAIEQARARASAYAQTLGLQVRRLVSIGEGSGAGFHPMPRMAMAAMADSMESTPIVPGENIVTVTLDVLFELGR